VRPMIRGIINDLLQARTTGYIAGRFHNTIARIVVEMSVRIRKSTRLNRVCLSGGTFQNHFLLERSVRGFREQGFEVFLHESVPPNDGGISLGQAVIANKLLRSGG
jgi:hydrogenase maturation protein HypF